MANSCEKLATHSLYETHNLHAIETYISLKAVECRVKLNSISLVFNFIYTCEEMAMVRGWYLLSFDRHTIRLPGVSSEHIYYRYQFQ